MGAVLFLLFPKTYSLKPIFSNLPLNYIAYNTIMYSAESLGSLRRSGARLLFLAALGAAVLLIWFEVAAHTPSGVLTFAVLNIGQGDALYIEGPTGVELLIDAGSGDGSMLRELPKVMPLFKRSLDAVIATHPDADHVGGFIDLLKRYRASAFIESGINDATLTYQTLEREVADEKIPRYIARRGMTLDLGGGAELSVLYPDLDVSNYGKKTNEGSVVARLTYGATSVMLTADAPTDVESHLIALDGAGLRSDILKVGHHGSRFSTGTAFAATVHPSLAIISVGANNRYGHPSDEALAVLATSHIPVLRTDEQGTLVFKSDGKKFWPVSP